MPMSASARSWKARVHVADARVERDGRGRARCRLVRHVGCGRPSAAGPVNPDILFGSTSSLEQPATSSGRSNGSPRSGCRASSRMPTRLRNAEQPAGAQEAVRRGRHHDDRRVQRRERTVDQLHRPDQIPKTIADHVAFARFSAVQRHPLEVQHGRPAGRRPSDVSKRLANTLNEIGRQTLAMGIKLARIRIWGPMERERDVRRVMELTDPKYVWRRPTPGT